MKLATHIAAQTAQIFAIYATFAFVAWDFDVSHWDPAARALLVLLWSVASIFAAAIAAAANDAREP